MTSLFETPVPAARPAAGQVWTVGALTRAVADLLQARFNPVAVRGEISGFARAASGHCYFTLKDEAGQLRCAMFRRAAGLLDFAPRDGDRVELRGRLSVYEARGDLQLVVESMVRDGQGALFEEFLRLKARLEAEGLFDPARKRPLPQRPRAIGLVTSLGAAALRDVLSTLQRRVPHVPVLLAPAAVQGAGAAPELAAALQALYERTKTPDEHPPVELILLVRGGGSIEDLWAFNDEQLARVIAASPVPVLSGVGHETDFTIADFVADLRAPTPTAAAELACVSRQQDLERLLELQQGLQRLMRHRLDSQAQRLDRIGLRLGRPSERVARERLRLAGRSQQLQRAAERRLQDEGLRLQRLQDRWQRSLPPRLEQMQDALARWAERLPAAVERRLEVEQQRLQRADLRLSLLDPSLVLQRGYAWLQDGQGRPVSRAADAQGGDALVARLADGRLDVEVTGRHVD